MDDMEEEVGDRDMNTLERIVLEALRREDPAIMRVEVGRTVTLVFREEER